MRNNWQMPVYAIFCKKKKNKLPVDATFNRTINDVDCLSGYSVFQYGIFCIIWLFIQQLLHLFTAKLCS